MYVLLDSYGKKETRCYAHGMLQKVCVCVCLLCCVVVYSDAPVHYHALLCYYTSATEGTLGIIYRHNHIGIYRYDV